MATTATVRKSMDQIAAELGQLPARENVATRAIRTPQASPAMEEDAQYRAAYGKRPYGKPLRAAFYAVLPPAPRGRYLSRDDAKRYLAHIVRTIEHRGWTPRERETLRQLERKWERRAAGLDARYNAMGTAPGMNERFRPKSGRDILTNIRRALAESAARTTTRAPGVTFVNDPAWPLGRPTLGR